MSKLLPQSAAATGEEHAARRRLYWQSRCQTAPLPQRHNPAEPVGGITGGKFTRPYMPTGPVTSLRPSTLFYLALSTRCGSRRAAPHFTALRCSTCLLVGVCAGQRERFARRQTPPSPQDANNTRADYAQSDYNLPVANVLSVIYDLPFWGATRRMLTCPTPGRGFTDTLLGGWQISAISTITRIPGTPFANITYNPECCPGVEPADLCDVSGSANVIPAPIMLQGRTDHAGAEAIGQQAPGM